MTTTPNVVYKILSKNGSELVVDTPAKMPSNADIDGIFEPIVSAEILTPKKYIGNIMTLCQRRESL